MALWDNSKDWEGLTPLREPLTQEGILSSFTARWSEPHQVSVTFPSENCEEIAKILNSIDDVCRVSMKSPSFDLSWQVHERGELLGSGSGRSGTKGAWQDQQNRGFGLGMFPAQKGRTYQVSVVPGPDFAPLLSASPSMTVRVSTATASVGLAIADGLRKPIAYCLGAMGILLGGIGL